MNYFVIIVSLLCNEIKQKRTCILTWDLHIPQNPSSANMIMVVALLYVFHWKSWLEQEWHNTKRLVFYKIITEVLTTLATESSSGQTLTYSFLWTLYTRKIYGLVLDANHAIKSLDAWHVEKVGRKQIPVKRPSRRHTPSPPQSYNSKDED